MKVFTAMAATWLAAAGAMAGAGDGGGATTIFFDKCPNQELHLIFSLDNSNSMNWVQNGQQPMRVALPAMREVITEVYLRTTFACLEWEAQNFVTSCRQNGFTTMRMSTFWWGGQGFIKDYEKKQGGHANYKRLWYEWESSASKDNSYYDPNTIKGSDSKPQSGAKPIMSVERIREAYNCKQQNGKFVCDQTDAQRDASRKKLKDDIRADIMRTQGNGAILPYLPGEDGTCPTEGLKKVYDYVLNDIDVSDTRIVTFQLMDADIMYGYEPNGKKISGSPIQTAVGKKGCIPYLDAISDVVANKGGTSAHYGIGIAGVKKSQELYYEACGIGGSKFTHSNDLNAAFVATFVSQALGSCTTCRLNTVTGVVSGGLGCASGGGGGGGGDNNGPVAEQTYVIMTGKASESGIPVDFFDAHEYECGKESFSFPTDDPAVDSIYQDVNTCKIRKYIYCADIKDPWVRVNNALCSLPSQVGGSVDNFVYESAISGDSVTDNCKCTCDGIGNVGEDYFCSIEDKDLVSDAYLTNLEAVLSGDPDFFRNTTQNSTDTGDSDVDPETGDKVEETDPDTVPIDTPSEDEDPTSPDNDTEDVNDDSDDASALAPLATLSVLSMAVATLFAL